jgi:hypothetical protein
LSECFNHSEDEFEFHISHGEEIMQALSAFNEDKWKNLSVEIVEAGVREYSN